MSAVAADPDCFEAIIADNEKAHAASGHWGVPTFVFENEPFFGQDRIRSPDLAHARQGSDPPQLMLTARPASRT